MINRVELKVRSRALIRGTANPKPLNMSLLYMAVAVVLSVLSMRLVTPRIGQAELMRMVEQLEAGNVEYIIDYAMEHSPSGMAHFIDTLLSLAGYIVSAGFIIFILNVMRNNDACYENLLDGFGHWWRLIVLYAISSLFIALWSVLLVVPGIIAAYSYRQAIYILLDNPQMRPLDCLRESKRMMQGHKWELFVLDLSFIGWKFLSALYVVGWIVSVWTAPYFGFTYALYYEQLKAMNSGYGSPEFF